MALRDWLRFHLQQFCGLHALGQLCSTARGWVPQTQKAIAEDVMQTKFDIDQLCMRQGLTFPHHNKVQFLVLRNPNLELMDRGTWTEVCRLQCCLSFFRKVIGHITARPLLMRHIVNFLVPGIIGNLRIDECTLLGLYRWSMTDAILDGQCDDAILDAQCADALSIFSQTWSLSCVEDDITDFTIGNVLKVLFKSQWRCEWSHISRGLPVDGIEALS